ncbi:Thioredoxin-like protein 1 [Orchesella cincta]|uniref:Thioredoxin-like protein 1 n=1 Tax=Orchesella cincta TaxID=48709 RepID=A0A1D2MN68_ORCCI|nr:Thioredoxin-like protein 1 [Orchesella cincta]
MSNIKIVADDDEFNAVIKAAGDDLVVIDFFTTWCRPCRSMEPVFEEMAMRYPKVIFLKVDADKCFDTAMSYRVTGVPYFVIYFNKMVVETVQGANQQELELKIRLAEIESRRAAALQQNAPNLATTISTFGRLGSIAQYIDFERSQCINDLSPTSFHNFLIGKKLVSGKGSGKLLLLYAFTQKVMLQSFKIRANPQTGPKVLRFFINHPKVLDFGVGSTLAPSQEVTLSHQDLTAERAIELRSGGFQMVTNVQIFVTSGQSKNSKIEIESLQLFGAPVLSTQPLTPSSFLSTAPSYIPTAERSNCNNQMCTVDQSGQSVSPSVSPSTVAPHQHYQQQPPQLPSSSQPMPGPSRHFTDGNHNQSTAEESRHRPSFNSNSNSHHHNHHQYRDHQ